MEYPWIGGWGEERSGPTGKSFRVVRACVRAACMPSQIQGKFSSAPFPFSLFMAAAFPFSLSGNLGETK